MSGSPGTRLLTHAPLELESTRLKRLGEGVGKVVYASPHWVVKRERSPSEVLALIAVWKFLRRVEKAIPGSWGKRLSARPARQIRLLRVVAQTLVSVIPRSLWLSTHMGAVWRQYRHRDQRGEALANEKLLGTGLVPERVEFPPVRVRVGGWPGWLTVREATQRVEATLHQRLLELSRSRRFDEMEIWLDRFLALRQAGWSRGIFSVDAHLKNFGVTGDRIVLLDPGGLTDDWSEVEQRLSFEEVVTEPHIQLGLGPALGNCPALAARFNERWKSVVNRGAVARVWSSRDAPHTPFTRSVN